MFLLHSTILLQVNSVQYLKTARGQGGFLFQFSEVAKERAPCLYPLTQNEGMSGKDLARTDKVSVRINIENF